MTSTANETIRVNGQERPLQPEQSVLQLIEELGLERDLVAVEINTTLVRRSEQPARLLRPGDRVEIVEFVGGG